jgi:hypothetical protein
MATKTFPVSWVGVYRASSNSYYGGVTPIRVGGPYRYNSYIGTPTSVKDAIRTSKTTPKLKFRFYVYNQNNTEFDFGGHRETYNKASGTMPWYKYLGLHPIYNTNGWKEVDLTSAFMDEYLKGSLHGIVLYGGSTYGGAYGKTGDSNQAVFVVEGTWNTPPEPPSSITNPKSSTIAQDFINVQWTAGSDNEDTASQLKYELGYYDGSKWREYWTVGAGVLEYNYPVFDKPETSRARFSIRSIDTEGEKSGWKYSPYFTVNHNRPPSKPTNLTPAGGKIIDRSKVLRVTWKHNDDGVQAGYRLAWRTVSEGGSKGAWNYIPSNNGFVNSTSQYHDFSPETFPLGEIEWTVKTKDQQGEESPYATYERFYAGEASDAPIWLNPSDGAILNSSEVVAQWSSLDQIQYEIELLSSGVVLWSESDIASNKSTLVGYSLENNKTYTLRIRVVNEDSGLWSDWSTINFTTQFIPPTKPILTVQTTDEDGTSLDNIVLSWETDNPANETPTDYVQVFRREYNAVVTQPWQLIGDNQAPNSSMVDYSPASEQTYEYMVRAWGENDTYSESDIVEAEIKLARSFLQRAYSPSDLFVIETESRSEDYDFGGEMMVFANRVKPVFEHGINDTRTLSITFSIDTAQELRNLIEFIKRRETFLYRDNAGRKFYCVIQKPKINDKVVNGFEVDLTLSEVDFDEIIQGG